MNANAITAKPFDASTLIATQWLRKYAPERLDAWLARHPDGLLHAIDKTVPVEGEDDPPRPAPNELNDEIPL